ncbi:MAG: nitrogen fixation protein NifH [Atribacterota bacterium]|nr:nitrogen fixation protein NifH [Atribacterota bacterium]
MNHWKSILNADPITWLLEDDNPSVKYFTLVDLLEKSKEDPEVLKAKAEIMQKGVVPKILDRQKEEGYWEEAEKFYTAKYKGTVWQILILAELGADGRDDRIKKACEFILNNSQDCESHGFSINVSAKTGGGRPSGVIPCLTGNLVYSLIRLGYLKDDRVQNSINWISTYQRFDDGIKDTPKDWPYERWVACWGKHSCHMGAVKALKALTEIPVNQRNKEVKNKIEEGVEHLLKHHIYKKSHDLSRVSKPGWLRLGFPLMYQDDILEILGILTQLGYHDERMQEAIDILISKQDREGRWKLENTFNGRFQTNIEEKGKPSKWITLNALKVLKNFYS